MIKLSNNLMQLFAYWIGQAETLSGFKVISTNTDGLYAVCDSSNREKLRQVLADTAKSVGVDIEPEGMRLISKDANNRIEISFEGKVLSAGGADTACYQGPSPNKSLSHPALIDRLLVDYLVKYGISEPFSEKRAMDILSGLKETETPVSLLLLYLQIINSSEGSVRYIFGEMDDKIYTFQHNNRVFAVKRPALHLWMANGQDAKIRQHDPIADDVLSRYGVSPDKYQNTRVIKISRIDPAQNMLIYNGSLSGLSEEEARQLIGELDDGYYIDMLRTTYNNWCNLAEGKEDIGGEPDEGAA